jgi:NRAMP (natural resistance-associated macrophage protein)-like metal ion transporter
MKRSSVQDSAIGKKAWWKKLGPGLITGAADDDPSGIATYSQGGAQFGFGMLWTLVLTYPLMVGIQLISARIGRVSGKGLATNVRLHYPISILYAIISLLFIANTINIAADVAAMGEALTLLIGGYPHLYAFIFVIISLSLQVFIPYNKYVRVLKWLTLVLFAYVGIIFVVHIPWWQVFKMTFIPHFVWSSDYITMVVAIFGTTISPYLFFWQASQEVEELHNDPGAKALIVDAHQSIASFRRIKIDTLTGMGISNAVAFFIMLTTAVTLHLHHVTNIQTSAQAASALKPVAGKFAFWLFSFGIIGTGMLAIPVLAGSAAYAMAGAFDWKNSLEAKPAADRNFYLIITLAMLIGLGICFTPMDPIKALFWSAVINGVISVPIMVIMILMAMNKKIMGEFVIGKSMKILGWICTGVMAIAVLTMFLTMLLSHN